MQINFLRQAQSENLVFFALGWGCDSSVIQELATLIPENYDIVCTYNYADDNFEKDSIKQITKPYKQVYLCAWSFGVWASEQMFQQDFTFKKALALCASPFPVDANYGIDPKRLSITIKGFKSKGTELFDKAVYAKYLTSIANLNASRSLESKIAELEALAQMSAHSYSPNIQWDKAIIGSEDVIFPAKNLETFWGIRSIVVPLPHFPFGEYELILSELDIQ